MNKHAYYTYICTFKIFLSPEVEEQILHLNPKQSADTTL